MMMLRGATMLTVLPHPHVTEQGKIAIEPRREDYPSIFDYEKARDTFKDGRRIGPG